MTAGYRKGTVLGLTIAEIFILLIFLLLLATLALNSQWNEEKKGYEEKLTELLSGNTDERFITPKQIETLYVPITEVEQARDRYQEALAKELGHRKEAEEALANELGHRKEAEEALEKARKGKEEVESALDVLRRKGENPPCWYEIVATGDGKIRERTHYLFNVALYDTSLVMAPSPVPSGAATDDGGRPYAEEARRLGVADLPYRKHLSDEAFTKHLKPLVERGKQSKVRTYSCVFFIRVWDETSPGAKGRWKQAHDRVLEGMFGTYDVRDDPWPEPR